MFQLFLGFDFSSRTGFRLSPNRAFGGRGSKDNDAMFPFFAKRMGKFVLAYLHLMDGLVFESHELSLPVTAFDMKKKF